MRDQKRMSLDNCGGVMAIIAVRVREINPAPD
jgi:hypothetical protein